MGGKARHKPQERLTKGEVRELLKDRYGGQAYLSAQLKRVFVPVRSSPALN